MYMPAHFSEERLDVLHDLIHQHPLASMVSLEADGMTANHIPFIITPPTAEAPLGKLLGHVARANPVWQNREPVLLIFQGPSAYITPGWYEEKKLTGAVVPTYNYAVVHVHGKINVVEDSAQFLSLLTQLTEHFESTRPKPWAVADAPPEYIENMMAQIVGIEIPITRLVGKWKTSQNKSTSNRSHIAVQLREENNMHGVALADIMEAQLFDVSTDFV